MQDSIDIAIRKNWDIADYFDRNYYSHYYKKQIANEKSGNVYSQLYDSNYALEKTNFELKHVKLYFNSELEKQKAINKELQHKLNSLSKLEALVNFEITNDNKSPHIIPCTITIKQNSPQPLSPPPDYLFH